MKTRRKRHTTRSSSSSRDPTAAARQRRHRASLARAGFRPVSLALPIDVVGHLDELAAKSKTTRTQIILAKLQASASPAGNVDAIAKAAVSVAKALERATETADAAALARVAHEVSRLVVTLPYRQRAEALLHLQAAEEALRAFQK